MNTRVFDLLRARLLRHVPDYPDRRLPPLPELARSQWSPAFERLCRNRLVMGAFRYGQIGTARKPTYSNTRSAIRRLRAYERTGNLEHLVDAANLCQVEFVESVHPSRHFAATDDGDHVSVINRPSAVKDLM